jgi:hypothetical protein
MYSRRRFLTQLGLATAAAPLVPRTVWSQPASPPKRFIAFYSSNGTIVPGYLSTGSGSTFDLGYMLAPLEPFKERLLVLRGLNQNLVSDPGSHARGLSAYLTGYDLATLPTGRWSQGISLDQHIANHVGTSTPFKSLELGVAVDLESSTAEERMSYRGPGDPLPPIDDPMTTYSRLFASVAGSATEAERQLARRASVMDFVREELTSLRGSVGAERRHRIDAHLTSLRQMEQQLQAAATTSACSTPGAPMRLDPYDANNYPTIGRLQIDMLVAAMACDLTRVGSIMFSGSISNQTFPWLGISQGHHGISHAGSGAYATLAEIKRWHTEQFLYLLQRLDSVSEDGGTLLDNTVVLWGSECGHGNHDMNDLRFVLAGSCGGYFRTGRRITFTNRAHADLLVTILQAMGIDEDDFGQPGRTTGAITELT